MRVAYWAAFALSITLLPSDAHAIDVKADVSKGKKNENKNRKEHIASDDDNDMVYWTKVYNDAHRTWDDLEKLEKHTF